MRAAIELSRAKMRANCGGPFGAVVVRDGKIIARGWNRVTSANRPHGTCRGHGHPRRVQEAEDVPTRRLRALHQLRAVSDVSGGDLLGAFQKGVLRQHAAWTRRKSSSTINGFTAKWPGRLDDAKFRCANFFAARRCRSLPNGRPRRTTG